MQDLKDKLTQLILAGSSRRLQAKEAAHRCPDAFMYSVVWDKRRKSFVLGHVVKVHGENGGTGAFILNILLDGGE